MVSESLSLPAWVYKNEEFLQLEKKELFKSGWQLACHISDLPESGSYVTFRILNESVVVVRNENDDINAFYNVCRHRAARLLDGDAGKCERRIKCPYHAWTYDYDGKLLGAPNINEYPDLDKALHGLFPVEVEVYLGFVFIRLEPGEETVAQMMAPVHEEFALYKTEEMVPFYDVHEIELPVNWKAAVDNFLDGIHVRFAHPGLNNLIGEEYQAEVIDTVYRAQGPVNYDADATTDVKRYSEILPEVSYLPPERQGLWVYYFIWPNTAFNIQPDKLETMQFVPTNSGSYIARFRSYAVPDARPEMQEARELADKINFITQAEDDDLLLRIQEGMNTDPYTQGVLGEHEVMLRDFVKRFREKLPVSTLTEPPTAGQIEAINTEMLK